MIRRLGKYQNIIFGGSIVVLLLLFGAIATFFTLEHSQAIPRSTEQALAVAAVTLTAEQASLMTATANEAATETAEILVPTLTAEAAVTQEARATATALALATREAELIGGASSARAATQTAIVVEQTATAEAATAEFLASITPTPTVLPSPVAIDEEADSVRLGEMAVTRPFAITQGASASWLVEIYIPELYASLEMPTDIEFVRVSLSEPPEEGALYSTDQVSLWISRYMQVELRVPAGFTLNGPPAVWKEINLDDPRPQVIWEWLLTAPDRPGTHEILLNIYQARVAPNATEGTSVDARQRAIPPRRYQLEVIPFTPTPTQTFTPTPTPTQTFTPTPIPPTATPTPTSTATPTPTVTPTPTPVPFFDRPGTTAGITALATILAAIIGVFGMWSVRDRIPPLTKGQKRRSLEKQLSEKTRRLNLLKEQQSRHGINTDPAILTEIEDLEGEIERLEQELKALNKM